MYKIKLMNRKLKINENVVFSRFRVSFRYKVNPKMPETKKKLSYFRCTYFGAPILDASILQSCRLNEQLYI